MLTLVSVFLLFPDISRGPVVAFGADIVIATFVVATVTPFLVGVKHCKVEGRCHLKVAPGYAAKRVNRHGVSDQGRKNTARTDEDPFHLITSLHQSL